MVRVPGKRHRHSRRVLTRLRFTDERVSFISAIQFCRLVDQAHVATADPDQQRSMRAIGGLPNFDPSRRPSAMNPPGAQRSLGL